MYLLLSGEGTGDMGTCEPTADRCERNYFEEGPMAIIIDQLIEYFQGYEMSHLETQRVSYVSETYLSDNKQPPRKKSMSLRGKKKPQETKYFYENARTLASVAKEISAEIGDKVIAILFRDADGTASANRGHWEHKRQSMIEGFKAEDYELGVAMIPKPKSEAWLLCATKDNPYQHCAELENESGNDKSTRPPLKNQLRDSLNGNSSKEELNRLLMEHVIDIHRIDIPSFETFKADLQNAIDKAL
ncbi:TPA: hypothetical protein ACVU4T_000636 [Vibrio parahaemolyticus]